MIVGQTLGFQLNPSLRPLGAGLQPLRELADVLGPCELESVFTEGLVTQLGPSCSTMQILPSSDVGIDW